MLRRHVKALGPTRADPELRQSAMCGRSVIDIQRGRLVCKHRSAIQVIGASMTDCAIWEREPGVG
jgi:hypothetical protein